MSSFLNSFLPRSVEVEAKGSTVGTQMPVEVVTQHSTELFSSGNVGTSSMLKITNPVNPKKRSLSLGTREKLISDQRKGFGFFCNAKLLNLPLTFEFHGLEESGRSHSRSA